MIYLPKSQPPPDCLANEKQKASGTYNCEGVAIRLQTDFKNKCYLCEQTAPTSINIEHFIPHQGDHDLKFDWNNLFYSCAHCNNVKAAWQTRTKIADLLNCTEQSHQVDEVMDYILDATDSQGILSKEIVSIHPLQDNDRVRHAAQLLNEIFQGTTEQKVIESANLREKIQQEIASLSEIMRKHEQARTPTLKQLRKDQIIKHLQPDSAFTAFKRTFIRKHSRFASWLNECQIA